MPKLQFDMAVRHIGGLLDGPSGDKIYAVNQIPGRIFTNDKSGYYLYKETTPDRVQVFVWQNEPREF
jgi:hypothetical protein